MTLEHFEHSNFLGVQDINASKHQHPLGPWDHQSLVHEDRWQEIMGEAARKNQ